MLGGECHFKLSCMNFKIRLLTAVLEEIEASFLNADLKPAVIGFTGTWLQEVKATELDKLKGYK